ncbi:MGMT family protein [bacterium]|nr:MGMT family protein [bacterium]
MNKRERKRSDFSKKVYEIVKRIPKGKTLTYKEVAKRAGKPFAWRAVGNILNKNRDPMIPCHRVVRSDKKVGGYRDGTIKKISLLKREGMVVKNKKLVL